MVPFPWEKSSRVSRHPACIQASSPSVSPAQPGIEVRGMEEKAPRVARCSLSSPKSSSSPCLHGPEGLLGQNHNPWNRPFLKWGLGDCRLRHSLCQWDGNSGRCYSPSAQENPERFSAARRREQISAAGLGTPGELQLCLVGTRAGSETVWHPHECCFQTPNTPETLQ